jgi:hypothetical protein
MANQIDNIETGKAIELNFDDYFWRIYEDIRSGKTINKS